MPIRNTRRVDSRFRDSQGKWITLVFLIRRVFIDLFFKEASGDFLINPSIYLKLLDVSTTRLFCLKLIHIRSTLAENSMGTRLLDGSVRVYGSSTN